MVKDLLQDCRTSSPSTRSILTTTSPPTRSTSTTASSSTRSTLTTEPSNFSPRCGLVVDANQRVSLRPQETHFKTIQNHWPHIFWWEVFSNVLVITLEHSKNGQGIPLNFLGCERSLTYLSKAIRDLLEISHQDKRCLPCTLRSFRVNFVWNMYFKAVKLLNPCWTLPLINFKQMK